MGVSSFKEFNENKKHKNLSTNEYRDIENRVPIDFINKFIFFYDTELKKYVIKNKINDRKNEFTKFDDIVDYISFYYYMKSGESFKISSLLDKSNIDVSFDDNKLKRWATNRDEKIILNKIKKRVRS